MKTFIFPGQDAQFSGMYKDLYDASGPVGELFAQANKILGFNIAHIMFGGTAETLKQTKVTQPEIFLHSFILAKNLLGFNPVILVGYSLGELSLTANASLSFEDSLRLVSKHALSMLKSAKHNSGKTEPRCRDLP